MCGPGAVGKDASGPERALFSPAGVAGIAAFNAPSPNRATNIRITSFIATLLVEIRIQRSKVTSIVLFQESLGDWRELPTENPMYCTVMMTYTTKFSRLLLLSR
jgi:hypothetical protein